MRVCMCVCPCSSTLTVTWSGTCATTTRTSMRTATKTLLTTVPTSPTATRRTTTRTGRETSATMTTTTTASLTTGTTAGWCQTGTSWTLTVSVAIFSLNFWRQRGEFKSNVKHEKKSQSHVGTPFSFHMLKFVLANVLTCDDSQSHATICENLVSTHEDRDFNGISCSMFYFHICLWSQISTCENSFDSLLKKWLTFSHMWYYFLVMCKNISSRRIKRSYRKTFTSSVKRLISHMPFS